MLPPSWPHLYCEDHQRHKSITRNTASLPVTYICGSSKGSDVLSLGAGYCPGSALVFRDARTTDLSRRVLTDFPVSKQEEIRLLANTSGATSTKMWLVASTRRIRARCRQVCVQHMHHRISYRAWKGQRYSREQSRRHEHPVMASYECRAPIEFMHKMIANLGARFSQSLGHVCSSSDAKTGRESPLQRDNISVKGWRYAPVHTWVATAIMVSVGERTELMS